MYVISMDTTDCERCFDCVTACPRGVIAEGPMYPEVVHPEECMGCMVCLGVCRPHGLMVVEVPEVFGPVSQPVLQ